MDIVHRIGSYYANHGIIPSFQRCWETVRRASYFGRTVLFFCRLPINRVERSQGVIVERVKAGALLLDDREAVLEGWTPQVRGKQIAERFSAGSELWLAKVNGKVAGFGWTIRGAAIKGHFFPLAEGDVHFFDFNVFPKYRGRGVNVELVNHILACLSEESVVRAHIECASWNTSQLRSLAKTPFRRVAVANKITVFAHDVVVWSKLKSS